MTLKIALIGDVHSFWTEFDTDYFNKSDYNYLFFTGDLPKIVGGVPDAEKLSELTKPGIVIPGNHDAATIPQFLAELKNIPFLSKLTSGGQASRVNKIRDALGELELGGYAVHSMNDVDVDLACITARPHSMGGDRLYFKDYLEQEFGISSMEESRDLLCRLVDSAPKKIIFLAHNGPFGLGDEPTDPWGCDFNPALGDFGDKDLELAVEYAKQQGKQVLAVIAGHMHHYLKGASEELKKGRNWHVRKDGVLHINAARVPRIFKGGDKSQENRSDIHHHIALTISDTVECEEVLVTPPAYKGAFS